jgi:hypothetical protein
MKHNILFLMYLFCILLSGCTKVVTLNFERHIYDVNVSKIIWIQFPGYNEEMPMILKLNDQIEGIKSPLENFSCTGKAWSYNLFNLKPNPMAAFHHQITGSKNIKNNCEDFINRPIWELLNYQGFKSAVLEKSANQNEKIFWPNCFEQSAFKKNLSYFHMDKAGIKNANFFNAEEPLVSMIEGDYFDRACQSGKCSNSLFNNVKSLLEKSLMKEDKFLFIIRDFSLIRSLEQAKDNQSSVINSLEEISKILSYVNLLREKNPEVLIILTSGQSTNIDIPIKDKKVVIKNQYAYSSVLVKGAGAENFCGYFQHEDIFKRVLWKSGYNF